MDRLNKEANILVAGAGTGKEIIDFSQNNHHWPFTGFDRAEPMLSIAGKKVAVGSLENKLSLVLGLIGDVEEKIFDAATSILGMHFLPDDGAKLNFLKGISDKLMSHSQILRSKLTAYSIYQASCGAPIRGWLGPAISRGSRICFEFGKLIFVIWHLEFSLWRPGPIKGQIYLITNGVF